MEPTTTTVAAKRRRAAEQPVNRQVQAVAELLALGIVRYYQRRRRPHAPRPGPETPACTDPAPEPLSGAKETTAP